jgi:hypothetical protein
MVAHIEALPGVWGLESPIGLSSCAVRVDNLACEASYSVLARSLGSSEAAPADRTDNPEATELPAIASAALPLSPRS